MATDHNCLLVWVFNSFEIANSIRENMVLTFAALKQHFLFHHTNASTENNPMGMTSLGLDYLHLNSL